MSEEDENSPSPPDDKPFFAIGVGDLGEEPATSPTTSDGPPTPMMIGSLSGSPSQGEAPDSADQTNPNPWGVSGPQLTGAVSEFSGQPMYDVPPMAKKEGFRWSQFFLGLFVPYIALVLLIFIGNAFEADWDDAYRWEEIELLSEDNKTFEHTLSSQSNEFLEYFDASFEFEDHYIYLSINDLHKYQDGPSTIVQHNESTRQESEIGQYYPNNGTVYFVLDNAEANRINLFVEFYDRDVGDEYESNGLISDLLFCLLPIGYLVGTIAAFVKGNKALGYGLLAALPFGIVFIPLLFFLFLMIAFGSYGSL